MIFIICGKHRNVFLSIFQSPPSPLCKHPFGTAMSSAKIWKLSNSTKSFPFPGKRTTTCSAWASVAKTKMVSKRSPAPTSTGVRTWAGSTLRLETSTASSTAGRWTSPRGQQRMDGLATKARKVQGLAKEEVEQGMIAPSTGQGHLRLQRQQLPDQLIIRWEEGWAVKVSWEDPVSWKLRDMGEWEIAEGWRGWAKDIEAVEHQHPWEEPPVELLHWDQWAMALPPWEAEVELPSSARAGEEPWRPLGGWPSTGASWARSTRRKHKATKAGLVNRGKAARTRRWQTNRSPHLVISPHPHTLRSHPQAPPWPPWRPSHHPATSRHLPQGLTVLRPHSMLEVLQDSTQQMGVSIVLLGVTGDLAGMIVLSMEELGTSQAENIDCQFHIFVWSQKYLQFDLYLVCGVWIYIVITVVGGTSLTIHHWSLLINVLLIDCGSSNTITVPRVENFDFFRFGILRQQRRSETPKPENIWMKGHFGRRKDLCIFWTNWGFQNCSGVRRGSSKWLGEADDRGGGLPSKR